MARDATYPSSTLRLVVEKPGYKVFRNAAGIPMIINDELKYPLPIRSEAFIEYLYGLWYASNNQGSTPDIAPFKAAQRILAGQALSAFVYEEDEPNATLDVLRYILSLDFAKKIKGTDRHPAALGYQIGKLKDRLRAQSYAVGYNSDDLTDKPSELGKEIRVLAPALEANGYSVAFKRTKFARFVVFGLKNPPKDSDLGVAFTPHDLNTVVPSDILVDEAQAEARTRDKHKFEDDDRDLVTEDLDFNNDLSSADTRRHHPVSPKVMTSQEIAPINDEVTDYEYEPSVEDQLTPEDLVSSVPLVANPQTLCFGQFTADDDGVTDEARSSSTFSSPAVTQPVTSQSPDTEEVTADGDGVTNEARSGGTLSPHSVTQPVTSQLPGAKEVTANRDGVTNGDYVSKYREARRPQGVAK